MDRPSQLHVGAGLWALRSTALEPANLPRLYATAIDDARFVESLGYDSFWVAEHRFWYDGWCPQPLVLAAGIAAATTTLRVGTAMHLLPQHTPRRSRVMAATLGRAFPGRIELGVSLGYRDEEFEGLGLRRKDRAPLLEAALDEVTADPDHPPVWIGGMAPAAMARAGRRGLSLLLPPTLKPHQLERCITTARDAAAAAGTHIPNVGMVKDVFVGELAEAERRIADHYDEYVTAWWGRDDTGAVDPARITDQIGRSLAAAAIGPTDKVADDLAALVEAGVDTLVLQIHLESTRDVARDQLARVATEIVPRLRSLALPA